MPDYGHNLLFGTFITPTASDPEAVVGLAERAEGAGLDLVTFQDHPYNNGLLDTWTLLSWVAARTSRVHVSANVLNLPLRPPAVVGRAAASLDLLSGGRFELGLGAGAFWDAIGAMGGRRLSPGEAVDALSEAIDIVRGVWDTSERGGLRTSGQHYAVSGMKRGPRPAHDIGVWLGAYKPRMLRLTGRKADGWLPTMDYLQPGDLRDSNRAIDEAAEAAGRDPREIRRLLNVMQPSFSATNNGFLRGPVEQWVEQLAPLVLEHGFSAFLIGGDDPRTFQTFGEEVAPALRELVARERASSGTATGGVGSVARLARRRDGIDYDAIPASLISKVVEPGDHAYETVRDSYSHKGSPGLVIRAESSDDVIAALAFARAQEVTLSVRSGGHGLSGRSTNDGGIVIDLSKLNRVTVLDRTERRVRVEPGARWGHVAQALAPHGLAISSGDYGDVGAGGLATTAGLGYMARKYGLTIDHVVAVELVTADGTLLRADAENHPDLFWAVRGAGANFGIVTAFELVADEVGDVAHALFTIDATDTAQALQNWGAIVEASPREITSFLSLFPGRRDTPPIAQVTVVYAGDDVAAAEAALTPFLAIGPVLDQSAQLVPYAATVHPPDNAHHGQGLADTHSGLLDHVTADVAQLVQEMIASGEIPIVQIRSAGGAVNDVAPDATAYAHRTQNFSILAATTPRRRAALDAHWERLYPHLDGMYLSFETDTSPERLLDAFPEPTLSRLREIKAVYDPDEIFDKNFNIPPAVPAVGRA